MTIDTVRNRVAVRLANCVLRLASSEYRAALKGHVSTGMEISATARSGLAHADSEDEDYLIEVRGWHTGVFATEWYAEVCFDKVDAHPLEDQPRLSLTLEYADLQQAIPDLRRVGRDALLLADELEQEFATGADAAPTSIAGRRQDISDQDGGTDA